MNGTSLHAEKRLSLRIYIGKSKDYCKLCTKTTQLCKTFALRNTKCFIHFYIL